MLGAQRGHAGRAGQPCLRIEQHAAVRLRLALQQVQVQRHQRQQRFDQRLQALALERRQRVHGGEIAALADTINSMIETLATFADQVTTVAREVGVDGKLGGRVPVIERGIEFRDVEL